MDTASFFDLCKGDTVQYRGREHTVIRINRDNETVWIYPTELIDAPLMSAFDFHMLDYREVAA